MRITNIDIQNYRQYQSLSFAFPASKSSDIHIIIAQNGVGKTNLLNAITWCLYGKEPHLGDDSEDLGLPKLNLNAIKEARQAGKEIEYVEIAIRAEDGDECITYKRCLPVRVIPGIFEEIAKEKFTVTISTSAGDPKVYEDKNETKRLVDMYMPEKIREYFYFDGEQLNNYFISSRKGKVKEAIFSISQVDIVNLIYKRLGDIIGDKQKEAASKAPDIKKIKDALDEADAQILSIENKLNQLEEQIAMSDYIIKENTEYLQGEDNLPELENRYQELRETQKNLEDEKKELMESMYSFIREKKISLTFYMAAKKTLSIINQKEADKALPPNIDKTLLLKALEDHTCTICNQTLSKNEEGYIKRLIDSFQVSSTTSHILMSIRSELERIINSAEAYPAEKKNISDRYQRLEKQLDGVDTMLGDVDTRINRISDKEEVKRRHNERQENEEIRKINFEKLGVARDQLIKAQEEKERLNKELKKALEKDAECSRIRQLIDFAVKGRCVIGSVEEDMMNEVRAKMEERTTYYFMQLIWKKNTYDRIVLNEEFQLDLVHRDGYSCVGTCSAAERCLLALSFTLALHEVSGFNSLLFIDTPVARVSDINRVNFANVLCEVSKNKQIIMTFSPDEYSPEIRKIFAPAARTNVELCMLDEKVTVIR
jgi:DNA sulfur modification protein DndD